jgi:FkbM family methyltransferase
MALGQFEPEETNLVRSLLSDVDVFVNVGANVGYYCLHALSAGKPVAAVEPIQRNLHYLLRNISENGWRKEAEIYPVALGADCSIADMFGGGTGASLVKGWASIPDTYVIQVPVATFDRLFENYLRGRKALILIDVEGAEYPLLRGAAQTLDQSPRHIWIVEINSSEHQPRGVPVSPHLEEIFDTFFSRGYRCVTADADRNPIDHLIVRNVATGQSTFATHNFLFF